MKKYSLFSTIYASIFKSFQAQYSDVKIGRKKNEDARKSIRENRCYEHANSLKKKVDIFFQIFFVNLACDLGLRSQ